MTSKTIDGVPRELLEEVVAQLDDFITGDALDRLKSVLAAPEAPRQAEPVFWCVEISGAEKPFSSKKAAENARRRYEKMFDAERMEPFPLYRHPAPLSPDHSGGGAGVVESPPYNCRQRLAAEGKPYPRSSCAVCGQFSPKWRECDASLDKVKELNQ